MDNRQDVFEGAPEWARWWAKDIASEYGRWFDHEPVWYAERWEHVRTKYYNVMLSKNLSSKKYNGVLACSWWQGCRSGGGEKC